MEIRVDSAYALKQADAVSRHGPSGCGFRLRVEACRRVGHGLSLRVTRMGAMRYGVTC